VACFSDDMVYNYTHLIRHLQTTRSMKKSNSKKIYVLTVSKAFPKTHFRSGQNTNFVYSIQSLFTLEQKKIHTIRANYELWKKRAKEINEGRAILSIRYWSDKPYRSKQTEICRLEKIGVEKLEDQTNFLYARIGNVITSWGVLAENDGLSFEDFCEWFKQHGTKEPMAIIHFTNFRYSHSYESLHS